LIAGFSPWGCLQPSETNFHSLSIEGFVFRLGDAAVTQARNARLKQACSNAIIARFWYPFDDDWTHGYVLDIGPEFFLLALIDENIKFNGFECHLVSDIKRLKLPDPYEDFTVAALRKQRQRIDRKPDIDLSSLPALLKSANAIFPLVTIQQERAKPGECFIGKVLDISEKTLLLHPIDPGAVWHKKPYRLRLAEITRVDFGGGYEGALHLVGGNPEPPKKSSRAKRP
jgi:hypothetical protein